MYTDNTKKNSNFFFVFAVKNISQFSTRIVMNIRIAGDEELINETSYCAAASIDFFFINVIGIAIDYAKRDIYRLQKL